MLFHASFILVFLQQVRPARSALSPARGSKRASDAPPDNLSDLDDLPASELGRIVATLASARDTSARKSGNWKAEHVNSVCVLHTFVSTVSSQML